MRAAPSYIAARAYQRARLALGSMHPGRRSWTGLRILGYHRISDAEHVLSVSPTDFRRQLEAVVETGLDVVRLSDALPLLESDLVGRRISITFDDGYRDFLDHALPILRSLGLPATVFVPTGLVGQRAFAWYADRPAALSWQEIEELVAEGLVDVQAHSRTHPWLPRLSNGQVRDEIVGSKRDLEEHVPYELTSFCFPAGLYSDRELELVREAGYRAAVTTDPGVNPGGLPMYRLRRTLIYWGDSPGIFRAKLAGLLDGHSMAHRLVQHRRARGRSDGDLAGPAL